MRAVPTAIEDRDTLEMLSQSRKRNLAAVKANRLSLIEGTTAALAQLAPVDIILANHVLYFWHEPASELAQLHRFLQPGGLIALGYRTCHGWPRHTSPDADTASISPTPTSRRCSPMPATAL